MQDVRKFIRIKFEQWYRELSIKQLSVLWASILIFTVILIINNPSKGYTRSYAYVKTSTIDEAITKWSDDDSFKKTRVSYWFNVSKYEKKYRNNQNWIPDGGFFYRKKNPIWWIYGYESKAYSDWKYTNENWDSDSIIRFKTLGGLINFLIFMVIITKILMWLTSIREARAS